MKNQALFSSEDKSKKLKCLLQFLFGALRVNYGSFEQLGPDVPAQPCSPTKITFIQCVHSPELTNC